MNFHQIKQNQQKNSEYYYNIIKINEILNNKNNCYYHVFKELVNTQNQMIKKKNEEYLYKYNNHINPKEMN